MRWTGLNKLMGSALVCSLSAAAVASDAPVRDLASDVAAMRAEMQQLRQSNQELRQEVTTLRGDQGENWLNERRAEEVKALVHEVLADADTRASLLESGMTAGHNGRNFFLASEDGSYSMTVSGQIQARWIGNWRDATGQDDHRGGFTMRRAKLAFTGHIADPRIGYKITFANSRANNNTSLEEAMLSYKITDELSLRGGRYKTNFAREENISSGRQMTVERSSINENFNVGWTEGVGLVYRNDMLRLSADFNDGARSGESGAQDFNAQDVDFAVTARADVKLLDGKWGQWSDFATWSNDPMALFIGGGIHYQVGETGTPGSTHNDIFMWTADSSFHWEGLTLYVAGFGAHDTKVNPPGGGGAKFDDYGFMTQVGYFVIPDKLQPFVRYELMMPDGDRAGAENVSILTFGANYFMAKHSAKFTVDVVWALDSLNGTNFPRSGFGGTGVGLLNDTGNNDGQVALRAQVQLLF